MKLKNKYLIALDLDGTLLKDNKKISIKTRYFLKNLAKRGQIFIFSSGRPIRALLNYYNQLKLDTPIISYNGARIFDPKKPDAFDQAKTFNKDMIKEIIIELRKHNIIKSMMSETDSEIWVDKDDLFLFAFFLNKNMVVNRGDFLNILDKDPITFIVNFVDNKQNREIIEKTVSRYPHIKVRFWQSDNYFELYYDDVSKYNKIIEIAKYYNINEENIYAFGDADNDIESLSLLSHGIAMANSPKEVKDIAKDVTKKDNNHNGIVDYLKKHLK